MKVAKALPAFPDWPPHALGEGQMDRDSLFQVKSLFESWRRSGLDAWDPAPSSVVDAVYNLRRVEGTAAAVRQAEAVEQHLRAVFGYTKTLDQVCDRVAGLESKVDQVLKKLGELGALRRSFLVPIESLEPEPYEIMRPFTAVVTEEEGEFGASVFDLNVFASGDTEEEAIGNLKETLIDTFDRLNELSDTRLGKGPLRQKNILNKCICRVEKG